MSFRRIQNAKDKWLAYCAKHETNVREIALPPEIFSRVDVLEDFLRSGCFEHRAKVEPLRMSDMSETSFLALERFVNEYFDFQDTYSALQEERFRRFKRYA